MKNSNNSNRISQQEIPVSLPPAGPLLNKKVPV
jgi:hypothetical protein